MQKADLFLITLVALLVVTATIVYAGAINDNRTSKLANKPKTVSGLTKVKQPKTAKVNEPKLVTTSAKLKEDTSKEMEDPSLDKAKGKKILGAPLSTIISKPFTSD